MKLSKIQIEILKLMSEGWELCSSTTFDLSSSTWLQKGGCGKGGQTKCISIATKHALFKKGLIGYKKYEFPTTRWFLTKKGVLSGLIKF